MNGKTGVFELNAPTQGKEGWTMSDVDKKESREESRREFLRKSAFAACATPVILSMLVEKASAAKSWNSGKGEITHTGSPPPNAPLGPDPGRGRDVRPNP